MLKKSEVMNLEQLMLSMEDSPAKTCPKQGNRQDLREQEAGSGFRAIVEIERSITNDR